MACRVISRGQRVSPRGRNHELDAVRVSRRGAVSLQTKLERSAQPGRAHLLYKTPETEGASFGCDEAMWSLGAAGLGEMVDVGSMVTWETNERRDSFASGVSG